MKNLRNRFNRFCLRHRHKGIPNLMLYITVANALVYIANMIVGGNTLYYALCFDKALILQGQVWRLLTCICTSVFGYGNILFVAIGLICYFSLGRAIESAWGTLRFNMFYGTGLLLMLIFAMIFSDISFTSGNTVYYMDPSFYASMGSYLNLSLLIAYGTLYPDARFLMFFIIPVRAWIFAMLYLVLMLVEIIQLSYPVFAFPHNLFPLVAMANYFLFFGKDVTNLIPMSWKARLRRKQRAKQASRPQNFGTIPFPSAQSSAAAQKVQEPYNHRCTVCGRTDISNPELEFRYCSRCTGYHCYCQDHIANHTHVE